jgi:hypothetical protein
VVSLSGQLPSVERGAILRLTWSGDTDLDYVGLDTSAPSRVRVNARPLLRAMMENGQDVTDLLAGDDGMSAVLDPGMRIWLLFEREADRERGRTYVFATVGRYELLVR